MYLCIGWKVVRVPALLVSVFVFVVAFVFMFVFVFVFVFAFVEIVYYVVCTMYLCVGWKVVRVPALFPPRALHRVAGHLRSQLR